MNKALELRNIDIVYGKRPGRALPLIDAGLSRDEILKKTGNLVGVSDASLVVGEGEIVVLMGLSGSGKSTLLRAVNGLAPVTRGDVEVYTEQGPVNPYKDGGRALRALRNRSVAMVFQQFALLPWRSVAENVGFGLELAGIAKKEKRERIEEQLALVGLAEWADQPVDALSGGMQQRVGLARALATGAPILLMDEPFSALDPLIRAHLQDELLSLQERLKKTILFVSHDLDEAIKLGNRIAIMHAGRIIQTGTAREIVRRPASSYVADFVAHANRFAFLTAEDIMQPVTDRASLDVRISATVKPGTSAAVLLRALCERPGTIGVIDRGRIAGTITEQDMMIHLAAARPNETEKETNR
ncbi:ATP-binding cassette domain-containing protein [Martelella lutilitoris]|uniref:ATP-binding cassette domain-containing protein n=1 Tax=Martelella lutilitoris TaxID=2583532 RepID=A0A5C4JQX9_9HYPH|nr:ATP-binding cassette domain-containing protein [Martelella lutilitoris]TNB47564.1 ATP-binding cassette domain-containing protein [Martelella lutilitoris]